MNILQILYKKLTKIYTSTIFSILIIFMTLIIINLDYLKNINYINPNNNFSISNIQNNIFNKIIRKNPKIVNEIINNKKSKRSNILDRVQINDNVKVEITILDNANNKKTNQTIISYINVDENNVFTKYLLNKKINNEIIISLGDIAMQMKDSVSKKLINSLLFYKIKIISINRGQ